MPPIQWTESLSVGDPAMDLHHRHLIQMLSRLNEAVETASVVGSILADLMAYVDFHFSEEESRLAAAGFPKLEAHRQFHHRLTEAVIAMQRAYTSNPDRIQAAELYEFLSRWLIVHIQSEDMAYRPWLQKLNSATMGA